MTFLPRLIVVALAAAGLANIGGSMAVAALWRQPIGSAATRSSALFYVRLVPGLASFIAGLLALAAMIQFEPRSGDERTGQLLIGLAAVAVATFITMAVRL